MLEGAQRRDRRGYELATFQAWQTARMSREERLKKLDRYLGELRKGKPTQGPAEMLAALRVLATAGSGMTIRRVDADAE